jgi:SAM-dependent methyltransferase
MLRIILPMSDEVKRRAQAQFGAHAQSYVESRLHARGASLARLVELTDPQPNWRVLDVATGGGHTALAFAPHVARVVASDLTHPILLAAREHASAQGAHNVTFVRNDAGALPFASGTFDAVTCRLAAHHFPDVAGFVREGARVVGPGGWVAVVDNVVPGEKEIAEYVNTFDALRDPSHAWAYSVDDWQAFFVAAGLEVRHSEVVRKPVDLDEWAARTDVAPDDLTRLRVLLLRAPDAVLDFLNPRQVGSRVVFDLSEALIVARS